MNVHSAYLAIITFRSGVTDEDQRARRPAYIVYGLNHVSHALFQSLSVIYAFTKWFRYDAFIMCTNIFLVSQCDARRAGAYKIYCILSRWTKVCLLV